MINNPINRWWTVFAGSVGNAFGAGTIMVYAYGILAVSLGAEFGWDRTVLGANMTAFLIGSGLGSVTLGWLISRYGVRLPSAIMAGMFGILFALVIFLPPIQAAFLALFLLIGFGGAAGTAMPYAVAISGFFDARRGLALGIVVAGSGFGATFGPRLAQWLVDDFGWRTAFVVIGLAAGLVAVAGLTFLVRTPAGVVADRRVAIDPADRLSIGELFLTNRYFWLIALPILGVSIAAFGGMATLVPLFRDNRFDPATIAAILSFAGLSSWLGRVVVGYLLDKIFAPFVCAGIFTLAATGLAVLVTTDSVAAAYAGAALIAVALGAEADLVTFLVSRYFRLIDFSRVVGVIWVVWAWGGGIGTVIAGEVFLIAGSYQPAYFIFAAMLLLGGLAIAFIGPYRNPITHAKPAQRPEEAVVVTPVA